VGQDAKWAVILREFNSRASEGSQKTEASLKRAAKKIAEQAKSMEDALDKFSRSPAQSSEDEGELLGALLQKYAEHRGTGEDAKWTVVTREFNLRASDASQKSEASMKRMAKKASEKPAEKSTDGTTHAAEKAAKPKSKPKESSGAAPQVSSLLRLDGYIFENTSDESLSVRWFSRSAEEYEGPVGELAGRAKVSLEFLAAGELEGLLAGVGSVATDTLMVRGVLFMMRMRLKTPDWRFSEELLGACCGKWAKEGERTEDALATEGTVELHVWPAGASAESAPPAERWEIMVCRCEEPADGSKPGWGAKFGAVAE